MSEVEILESYGVRFGIEEMFKDLKEVWAWGKALLEHISAKRNLRPDTVFNMVFIGINRKNNIDILFQNY